MSRALQGRGRELEALAAGARGALEGRAVTFALVGEPGIGKSRLVVEAARRAARAGLRPAWGRAWEAGGAPAYWPWRLLVGSIAEGAPELPPPASSLGSAEAAGPTGGAHPALASLTPAAPGAALPGPLARLWGRPLATDAAAADPDQARFELFDAVAGLLRAAAARTPLLVILEDLHAADLPSLELTAFATRHLQASRVAWLLTWREPEADQEPVRELIARVRRDAIVLPLRGLSPAEADGLIDEIAPDAPRALRDTLTRVTAGNPLLLVETLHGLVSRGAATAPVALEQLPVAAGVAVLVRERLASLSPASRRALEGAAGIGREVDLERWTEVAELPAELLLGRAAEVVATGVLVESGRGRWTFSHDLVREAISREVPPAAAARIHRRMALALDRAVRAGDPTLAGERLHHGLLAMGAIPPLEVAAWAVQASDQARAQCAYEEAQTVLERALTALGPSLERDGELLLAQGRARADLGHDRAAREVYHAAMEVGRSRGEPRLLARAVLGWGSRYLLGDVRADLVALLDEADAALGGSDAALRARLLARKAAALTPAARAGEALAMAREALAIAAGLSDEGARLEVAVAAGSAFGDFAHPRERIPVNQEVVRLARRAGDRALEVRGLSRLVTDHLEADELALADACLRERDELARSLKLPRFAWMEPLFRSMRAMVEGRFAVCGAAIADAEATATSGGDLNALRCIAVHRTWLLLLKDDVEGLTAHEPRALDALRSMPPVFSAVVRAATALRGGDVATARRLVEAIDPALPHLGAVNMMCTLAELAVGCSAPALLQPLHDRLAPHHDTNATWGLFGLTCGPPVAATLGLLAAALGEPREAARRFEAALVRTVASGARAHEAWVRYWYGRARLASPGDGARGQALLEEAEALATHHEMDGLARRCRDALEAGSAEARRASSPATATVAEAGWSLRPQGTAWLVEYGGRSFLLPPLRGLPMLARLLAAPDTEVHALELATGLAGAPGDDSDAGEAIDDQARAVYKRRLLALSEAIAEAEERADSERAERARGEREALARELSRATGRGGRTRRVGVAAERARTSVQRRIREAIRRIGEVAPGLAELLGRCVRTGTFCSYQPRRQQRME